MAVTHTEDFAGSAATIDGTAPTTGAGLWTNLSANLSNFDVRCDGAGLGSAIGSGTKVAYLNSGSADHYSAMAYHLANTGYGVAVRIVDNSNCIMLWRSSSTGVRLQKRVSGTDTDVASIVGLDAWVAGDVFELQATGNSPVNVKVFKNGVQIGDSAGYDVSDSVFDGVTNVGIWGSSPRNSAFDNWEGGTLVSDTLTIGTGPATRQIFQRPPTGDFALGLSGTFAGATPNDIEWRLEDQAGGLKTGYDWQSATPTIGSGTWSLTVDVPPDTDRSGYILKLRSVDSGAAVLASTQTNGFAVGDLWIGLGQSNWGGLFNSTGTASADKCAVMDKTTFAWSQTSDRIFYLLNALSALRGVPQGIVDTSVGATGIRYHAPAHTSTDGSVSEGVNWPVIEDAAVAFGDFCGEMRMIGESDSGGVHSKTQLKDAFDAIRGAFMTLTGRSASEFTTLYMITGRNDGGGGSDSGWQANREAQAEWCAATTGAYVAGDAITLSMSDNLHYDAAGYTEMARRFARSGGAAAGGSAYNARGPIVSAASIVGATVTVTFDLNGSSALTGTGTLDGWEYYDGSWNAATDAARSGNTVTFTGAGATQIRYLYGADPVVANVVRGDVKADSASPDTLPAEPTRGAVSVSTPSTLDVDSLVSEAALASPAAVATRALAADALVSVSALDAAPMTAGRVLAADGVASTASLGAADMSASRPLAVAALMSTTALGGAEISAVRPLVAEGLAADAALGAAAITADRALATSGMVAETALGSAAIAGLGVLAPDAMVSSAALGAAAISATRALAVAGVYSSSALGAADVLRTVPLAAAAMASDVEIDAPTISRTRALAVAGLMSTTALGGTVVAGPSSLAPDGLVSQALLGVLVMNKVGALAADGVVSLAALSAVSFLPPEGPDVPPFMTLTRGGRSLTMTRSGRLAA